MKYQKGQSGNPKGKKKGTTNKFTDLKQAYLDVFEKIEKKGEGKDTIVKTFFEWATKNDRNQGMFYQMLSKMLPTNIDADIKADLKVTIKRIISTTRPPE